ncbi:MAG: bifunctional hydroxymethylpyrimidine kinase/phosphomethylpyrimidine kinase [Acidobacteria bacterium]|nr:bifunctional hydroxymethylpyrimidine kinase/phosphomethylpyrimidine kinase [Acidobacteriota bacterium]MXZ59605.1 bifunctional hydroxymethylpyrimidine kinase/phosphomethylpyrimidine kinase [Acidobacteriota bacterium]MYF14280.1 bifunctional hydroxymethylpyrimidine kinase/phosphomethylpyrimidine kinase [Acidobacteriota bacterium]MYI97646.1 bifunctional hydroxymethylpyrimidine kinase/phosphomethylpyrimidine kinase [Acidobacteriota bacterium]
MSGVFRADAPPVALTIAGSDSGGGAGIQADLKTFAAHGVYGLSAITAVTAQNTVAVTGVQEIEPELVCSQIAAVVSDFPVGAAKTGMLSSAAIIGAVAKAVDDHELRVVVDPVMVAKSGHRLLRPDAVEALRDDLLPRATLLTPNVPEASDLTGLPVGDEDDMRAAGEKLLGMGARAVLMKGGHLNGDAVVDLFLDGSRVVRLRSHRIHTRATHGTGCTLSAAVAANLALGRTLAEAVKRARQYLRTAMLRAAPLGEGHGPLGHLPELS